MSIFTFYLHYIISNGRWKKSNELSTFLPFFEVNQIKPLESELTIHVFINWITQRVSNECMSTISDRLTNVNNMSICGNKLYLSSHKEDTKKIWVNKKEKMLLSWLKWNMTWKVKVIQFFFAVFKNDNFVVTLKQIFWLPYLI